MEIEKNYGERPVQLNKPVLPKPSASFVFSILTTRVSLLSLSDKSTVDVVRNIDVDYATESFCSSCAIPPCVAGGFWGDGELCDL